MDSTDENAGPLPCTPTKDMKDEGHAQNKRRPMESPFSSVTPSQRRPLKQHRVVQMHMEGDANLEATILEESRLDVTVSDLSLMKEPKEDGIDEDNKTLDGSVLDNTQDTDVGISLADELGGVFTQPKLDNTMNETSKTAIEPAASLGDELAALGESPASDKMDEEMNSQITVNENADPIAAVQENMNNVGEANNAPDSDNAVKEADLPAAIEGETHEQAPVGDVMHGDMSASFVLNPLSADSSILIDTTQATEVDANASVSGDVSISTSPAEDETSSVCDTPSQPAENASEPELEDAAPQEDETLPVAGSDVSRLDASLSRTTAADTSISAVSHNKTNYDCLDMSIDATQQMSMTMEEQAEPGETNVDEVTEQELDATQAEIMPSLFGKSTAIVANETMDDTLSVLGSSRPSSSLSQAREQDCRDILDMDISNAPSELAKEQEQHTEMEANVSATDESFASTTSTNSSLSKSATKKSKKNKKKSVIQVSPIVGSVTPTKSAVHQEEAPECVTPTPAMAAYSGTDIDPVDAVMSVRTPSAANRPVSRTSLSLEDSMLDEQSPAGPFIPPRIDSLLEKTLYQPADAEAANMLSQSTYEFLQEETRERTAEFESQINRLQTANQQYEVEIAELRASLEAVTLVKSEESSKDTDAISELSAANARLQDELAGKIKQIDYLTKDADGLKFMLEDSKERSKKQLSQLNQANIDLEHSIEELKSKLLMSQEFNNGNGRKVEELEQQLFAKDQQIVELASSVESIKQQLQSTNDELTAAAERAAVEESVRRETQLKMEAVQKDMEVTVTAWETETLRSSDLQEKLNQSVQRISEIESLLAESQLKAESMAAEQEQNKGADDVGELDALKAQLARLEEDMAVSVAKAAEAEKMLAEVEAERDSLKNDVMSARAQAVDSSEKLVEAEAELGDIRKTCETLQGEVVKETSVYAELKEQSELDRKLSEDLKEQLVAVRAEKEAAEAQIEELESKFNNELSSIKAQKEAADAQIEELNAKLTNELAAAKAEVEAAQTQIAEDSAKFAELTSIKAEKEATDAQIEELKSKLAELTPIKAAKEAAESEIEALTSKLGEQTDRLHSLEQLLASSQKTIEEAEAAFAQGEQTRKELEQAKDDLSMSVARAEEALASQKAVDESLTVELAQQKEEVVQLQAELDRVTIASEQTSQGFLEELRLAREDATKAEAKITTLSAEIAELQANLAAKAAELERVKEESSTAFEKTDRLTTENSQLAQKIVEMEQELQQSQESVNQFVTVKSDLEAQLAAAKESASVLSERIVTVQTELETQTGLRAVDASEADSLRERLASASASVLEKDAAITALSEELQQLKQKVVDSEKANASTASVAKLTAKIAEYEKVIAMGKSQLAKLKEEKGQLASDLEDARSGSLAELEKASLEIEKANKERNDVQMDLAALKQSSSSKIAELEDMIDGKTKEIEKLYLEMDKFDEIEQKLKDEVYELSDELKSLKNGGQPVQPAGHGLLTVLKQGTATLDSSVTATSFADLTQPIRIQQQQENEEDEEEGVAAYSSVPSTPTKTNDVTMAAGSATPLYNRQLDLDSTRTGASTSSPSVANRSGCTQQ